MLRINHIRLPDHASHLGGPTGRRAELLGCSFGHMSDGRAGKRLAAVETAALKVLLAKLEVAHALVQTCSEPGEL